MKRAIDRPDDPKPSGITLRHSQRPLPTKDSISSCITMDPCPSQSLLLRYFLFLLLLSFPSRLLLFRSFFSFKNSRCDTQREEPWEKFMWLAQTRPEFDSGTYCSFQLYGTPRSIAYRLQTRKSAVAAAASVGRRTNTVRSREREEIGTGKTEHHPSFLPSIFLTERIRCNSSAHAEN